jgi:hypothetical protein
MIEQVLADPPPTRPAGETSADNVVAVVQLYRELLPSAA